MYQVLNGLFLDIMQGTSKTKSNYFNTRNWQVLSSRITKKDMDYRPYLTWLQKFGTLYPKKTKQVTTLNEFKAKIKNCKLENCPCRLCRTYFPQIGFITCLLT